MFPTRPGGGAGGTARASRASSGHFWAHSSGVGVSLVDDKQRRAMVMVARLLGLIIRLGCVGGGLAARLTRLAGIITSGRSRSNQPGPNGYVPNMVSQPKQIVYAPISPKISNKQRYRITRITKILITLLMARRIFLGSCRSLRRRTDGNLA